MRRGRRCGRRTYGWLAGAAVVVVATALAAPVAAGSPVVDTVVTNTNDSGPGSLRQAILNANDHVGPDTITFAIGSGPQTISVLSPLPAITDPLQISALTQPGFSGQPIIELDGGSAGGGPGLLLAVGHTSVSGLVINRFAGDGIYAAVGFNSITSNYIGTDLSGTVARGNLGNGIVLAGNYASTIGGTDLLERNVISGNLDKGIVMVGPSNFNLGSNNNFVAGNYIGVDATGTQALGNRYWGVMLDNSTDNLIGGTRIGTGNVIAGSTLNAIAIVGAGSRFNWIAGNRIGTDASGTHILGSGQDGVLIADASHNRIGGTDPGARNLISGSALNGIDIVGGATTTGNVVQGNYIGTDIAGSAALPNTLNGVTIGNVPGNTVGGVDPGAGNLISGNLNSGVLIYGTGGSQNAVQGNLLGTDASGTAALGNGWWGVALDGATGNTIGGAQPGARNIVSGNQLAGILLAGPDSSGNAVQGNYVGLDVSGSHSIPNLDNGVTLDRATQNIVGGSFPGAANVISSNAHSGIAIFGGAGSNGIQGNLVGTDVTGAIALGNGGSGIFIINSAGNVVGGEASGAANLVSGNIGNGMNILGAGTTRTVVQGNLIGTNSTGQTALGNGRDGVFVDDSTDNVIGGPSTAARNVISGNGGNGISLVGTLTTRNTVQGNYVGTDITGSYAVGNALGVVIGDVPGNTVGGTAPGSGNLISGNHGLGVLIYGGGGGANVVQGNLVGTDRTGRAAIGNGTWGVVLDGSHDNTIGGVSASARNVLSGNTYDGLLIGDGATRNLVEGNYIGSDIGGRSPLPNGGNGITVAGGNSNTIGGITAGAGNVIAYNASTGVAVFSGTGNSIRGNSIVSNQGLGIDLGGDGITPNDRSDEDTGANNLENFPIITIAVGTPRQLVIVGLVDTQNATQAVIDIYANDAGDPSRHGEGQRLIGSVTPNRGGWFIVILPPQPKGTVISATTTDALGNTSEFSLDVMVGRGR